MAVLKEFRCLAHGEFESVKAICPHGCAERFVVREFRTAPAIKHGRTRRADWAINALAEDHGYTDINNSPSRTNSVAEFATRHGKIKANPHWLDIPHAEPGFSRNKDIPVPKVTAEQIGATSGLGFRGTPGMKPLYEHNKTRAVAYNQAHGTQEAGRFIETKKIYKSKDND